MRKTIKQSKKAFTLLELIIAMAIIAVLMGLGVFAISQAQIASRDTQRVSAGQDISTSLEQVYQNFGSYPTGLVWTTAGQVTLTLPAGAPAGSVAPVVPLKGAALYVRNTDQTASGLTNGALYCFISNGSAYALGVKAEGSNTYKYWGSTTLQGTCADQ